MKTRRTRENMMKRTEGDEEEEEEDTETGNQSVVASDITEQNSKIAPRHPASSMAAMDT